MKWEDLPFCSKDEEQYWIAIIPGIVLISLVVIGYFVRG